MLRFAESTYQRSDIIFQRCGQCSDADAADVRAVGGGEVGRDRVSAATCVPDLGNDRLGLLGPATVVNEDLSAGPGECERAGAAAAP